MTKPFARLAPLLILIAAALTATCTQGSARRRRERDGRAGDRRPGRDWQHHGQCSRQRPRDPRPGRRVDRRRARTGSHRGHSQGRRRRGSSWRRAGALRDSVDSGGGVEAAHRDRHGHRPGSPTPGPRSPAPTTCSNEASPPARKSKRPRAEWPTPKPTWRVPRPVRPLLTPWPLAASSSATFDGVVAKRSHNPGDLVEATASDAVLRVIDPQRLEVQAAVPIGDAPRVKVGAMARLADVPAGSPAATLKVVSRPVVVETGTASVPVRLAFATPSNYPAGTPVQVEIDTETQVERHPRACFSHRARR